MFRYYHKNRLLQLLAIIFIYSQLFDINQASANSDRAVSNANSACYVNEYESHEKRKCQFPFSIKDKLTGETKTFHGCTTYW